MKDVRFELGDTVLGAQALLGCHLVFGELRAQIVETEAYRGVGDPASHAYRGVTPRNEVMFGPVGVSYVYFNYGVHWMLNVVAHAEGEPGGVLVRAARPLAGLDVMRARRGNRPERELLNGPGKLCQGFSLDRRHNGVDLLAGGELRLEPGERVHRVLAGPRVGIAEGKGHETPWRFVDAGALDWISKPRLTEQGT